MHNSAFLANVMPHLKYRIISTFLLISAISYSVLEFIRQELCAGCNIGRERQAYGLLKFHCSNCQNTSGSCNAHLATCSCGCFAMFFFKSRNLLGNKVRFIMCIVIFIWQKCQGYEKLLHVRTHRISHTNQASRPMSYLCIWLYILLPRNCSYLTVRGWVQLVLCSAVQKASLVSRKGNGNRIDN